MDAMTYTTLSIKDLAEKAKLDPTQLATRSAGSRFLPILKAALSKVDRDQVVALDFADVGMMDPSFADEVFATLAADRSRRKFLGACLVLTHLNETLTDGLNIVLSSRPRRERNLGNCVFPMIDSGDKVQLVGPTEKHVQETFTLLQNGQALTAREVAKKFKLNITAASTRLKILYDLGLAVRSVRRDGPERQYTYRLPVQ